MENWFILVLIAGSIAGTSLIFLAKKRGAQKRLDYQGFAQEQGWIFNHDPGAGTASMRDVFRDPNDDWTLTVSFSSGVANDGMTKQFVEWHSPQGALADGEAVLGEPLPPKAVAMMGGGSEMGKQILKAALKGTFHALGNTRFNLTIDEATAGDPGGVVMASDGQAGAMDGLRRNGDLAAFRDSHKSVEIPVIIRNSDGLALRRPGGVKSFDDLTKLVTLGQSLRKSV